MHFSPLAEIVILFLLSILVNLAASKIRLPATVGFLLTGVLCGPSVLGLVSDKSTIDHVADLGVAMLMFTIGMELSGDALNRLKKPVFVGGSLQIGLMLGARSLPWQPQKRRSVGMSLRPLLIGYCPSDIPAERHSRHTCRPSRSGHPCFSGHDGRPDDATHPHALGTA